ncbi:MAG: hypothetical protein H7Y60_01005 [Rhodospirillaceae bacterium]|nr:hypothetical protein [Rhodospirillales bacterium]
MSRIGTYGANQLYLSRLAAVQKRLATEQSQVATEKKSTSYRGIAADTNRLINLENEKKRAQNFITSNDSVTTRLKAANVSMTAMETTMKNVQKRLDEFAQSSTKDQQKVEELQKWAFDAMVDMQSYLAANVDGQYIFSGGRVADEPVRLAAGSLEGFQQIFDGNDHTYPTTRAANLVDLNTDSTMTGNISFDAATGTINAASLTTSPNVLSNIPVGSRITIDDSAAGANDGKSFTVRGVTVNGTGTHIDVSPLTTEGPVAGTIQYTDPAGVSQTVASNLTFAPGSDQITVTNSSGLTLNQVFTVSGTASNNGTYAVTGITAGPPDTVTIQSTKVTTQAASANISLQADSWYRGDNIQLQQRIDTDRTVDVGTYASDPAFEKTFRALGLIAQGVYGTAGGLENNLGRVDDARFLIKDAIARNGSGVGPFGLEEVGDIEQLQTKVGVTANLIGVKTAKHKDFSGFLDTRIIDMENVDKTEAVARLLDDQQAMQTAYQTLATVRGLSLLNYMK